MNYGSQVEYQKLPEEITHLSTWNKAPWKGYKRAVCNIENEDHLFVAKNGWCIDFIDSGSVTIIFLLYSDFHKFPIQT